MSAHASAPNWSEAHANRLESHEKTVEVNYIKGHPVTDLPADADELDHLIRQDLKFAFHAGAGCSNELRNQGV
jgi:hypothetical protein